MARIYWRKEENAVLIDNPALSNRDAAVLVTALGFRACTTDDVKCRRRRLGCSRPVNPQSEPWPQAAVEMLRKHWEAGLTPGQISTLMPAYSRSSVRAKGLRMGWARPDYEGSQTGKNLGGRPRGPQLHAATNARQFQHGAGMVATGMPKPPRSTETMGPVEGSLNIRMWDTAFTSRCCKWATGEDESGFFFCAAPKLPGLPYCGPHTTAATRPSSPRPPSAVKDTAPRAVKEDDGEPKPLDFERAA